MSKVLSKAYGLLQPKKDTSFFYGFLPEKKGEFYNENVGYDLSEKLKPSTLFNYLNTSGIETNEVDRFRQGVELTQLKYYVTGLEQGAFKIHSGEPGSLLFQGSYGFQKNFRNENYFTDIEKFDPITFLKTDGNYTYPIIIGDNTDVETHDFNGVIEPLSIRLVASFYSIDVPFESHSVWANLEEGNMNTSRSYSQVVSVYERDVNNSIEPWLDMVDMMGMVKKVPSMGYFNLDKNFLLPFNDLKDRIELSNDLELQLRLGSEMKDILISSPGDTESYVPDGYLSATNGWMYDDVTTKGTDSLAFGGLGY